MMLPEISYSELFNTIYKGYLRKLALRAKVTFEDAEQEAKLLCWSVVVGQSTFDPTKGSAAAFVINSLEHWAQSQSCSGYMIDDYKEPDFVEQLANDCEDQFSNPLAILVAREEEAARLTLERFVNRQRSIEDTLFVKGVSVREIAKFMGSSKSSVYERIAAKHKDFLEGESK